MDSAQPTNQGLPQPPTENTPQTEPVMKTPTGHSLKKWRYYATGFLFILAVSVVGLGVYVVNQGPSQDIRGQAATNNCCNDGHWRSLVAPNGCEGQQWTQGYHACEARQCGLCQTQSGPVCGNGVCEAGQNHNNCPQDCSPQGTAPTAAPAPAPTPTPASQVGGSNQGQQGPVVDRLADGSCPSGYVTNLCADCLWDKCVSVSISGCNQILPEYCGVQPCYVTGTCESCNPGTFRCAGTTWQACTVVGGHSVWQTRETDSTNCSGGTGENSVKVEDPIGGAVDCQVGQQVCTSDKQYSVCGSNGMWGSPRSCPGEAKCINNSCIASDGSEAGSWIENALFTPFEPTTQGSINFGVAEGVVEKCVYNCYACENQIGGACNKGLITETKEGPLPMASSLGDWVGYCGTVQCDCSGAFTDGGTAVGTGHFSSAVFTSQCAGYPVYECQQVDGNPACVLTSFANPGTSLASCQADCGTAEQTADPVISTPPGAGEQVIENPPEVIEENLFYCQNISATTNQPKIGDTVNFTCSAGGSGINQVKNYTFRYRVDGGPYQSIGVSSANNNQTVGFKIVRTGTYQVQCRACSDDHCTAWQEL